MRDDNHQYNQSQCNTCYHKMVNPNRRPCESCEYIWGITGSIGSNHSHQIGWPKLKQTKEYKEWEKK